MLLTFKSRAFANITMFGDVGTTLLDMMQFGHRVPGAIRAEDVPQALENLRAGLARLPDEPEPAGSEEEDEPTTSLRTRALPLVQLLEAAIADESAVSWE